MNLGYMLDGTNSSPQLPQDSETPDFVATVIARDWEEFLSGSKGSGSWLDSIAADPEDWDGEAAWWSRAILARKVERGSRLYIASRGRLRLWVRLRPIDWPHTRVPGRDRRGLWIPLCIDGSPPEGEPIWQPCTIDADVRGFRGLRRRWWPRDLELPCPDWRADALGGGEGRLQPVSADFGRDRDGNCNPLPAGGDA